jgi:hypothetical protein
MRGVLPEPPQPRRQPFVSHDVSEKAALQGGVGGVGFEHSGDQGEHAGAADFFKGEAHGLGAGLGFRVAATRLDEAAHQITDGAFAA